ncbi:MAG: hypothetical protein MI741_03690, partial [Rhodospirillales bacterium]|nr:hypothetical protein [Rhodospirillales bacterium]
YRERLETKTKELNELVEHYNEAVRKTAVTELLVEDNQVCVVVRNALGEVKRIETPYPADREIYIDYVLIDGRLWIRRVFDDQTPPGNGTVIDPSLAEVDWGDEKAMFGKAVYRRLSEGPLNEGRWVVTVSGDGSLKLSKVDPETIVELAPPPPVRDYEEIEQEIEEEVGEIRAGEVFGRIIGG